MAQLTVLVIILVLVFTTLCEARPGKRMPGSFDEFDSDDETFAEPESAPPISNAAPNSNAAPTSNAAPAANAASGSGWFSSISSYVPGFGWGLTTTDPPPQPPPQPSTSTNPGEGPQSSGESANGSPKPPKQKKHVRFNDNLKIHELPPLHYSGSHSGSEEIDPSETPVEKPGGNSPDQPSVHNGAELPTKQGKNTESVGPEPSHSTGGFTSVAPFPPEPLQREHPEYIPPDQIGKYTRVSPGPSEVLTGKQEVPARAETPHQEITKGTTSPRRALSSPNFPNNPSPAPPNYSSPQPTLQPRPKSPLSLAPPNQSDSSPPILSPKPISPKVPNFISRPTSPNQNLPPFSVQPSPNLGSPTTPPYPPLPPSPDRMSPMTPPETSTPLANERSPENSNTPFQQPESPTLNSPRTTRSLSPLSPNRNAQPPGTPPRRQSSPEMPPNHLYTQPRPPLSPSQPSSPATPNYSPPSPYRQSTPRMSSPPHNQNLPFNSPKSPSSNPQFESPLYSPPQQNPYETNSPHSPGTPLRPSTPGSPIETSDHQKPTDDVSPISSADDGPYETFEPSDEEFNFPFDTPQDTSQGNLAQPPSPSSRQVQRTPSPENFRSPKTSRSEKTSSFRSLDQPESLRSPSYTPHSPSQHQPERRPSSNFQTPSTPPLNKNTLPYSRQTPVYRPSPKTPLYSPPPPSPFRSTPSPRQQMYPRPSSPIIPFPHREYISPNEIRSFTPVSPLPSSILVGKSNMPAQASAPPQINRGVRSPPRTPSPATPLPKQSRSPFSPRTPNYPNSPRTPLNSPPPPSPYRTISPPPPTMLPRESLTITMPHGEYTPFKEVVKYSPISPVPSEISTEKLESPIQRDSLQELPNSAASSPYSSLPSYSPRTPLPLTPPLPPASETNHNTPRTPLQSPSPSSPFQTISPPPPSKPLRPSPKNTAVSPLTSEILSGKSKLPSQGETSQSTAETPSPSRTPSPSPATPSVPFLSPTNPISPKTPLYSPNIPSPYRYSPPLPSPMPGPDNTSAPSQPSPRPSTPKNTPPSNHFPSTPLPARPQPLRDTSPLEIPQDYASPLPHRNLPETATSPFSTSRRPETPPSLPPSKPLSPYVPPLSPRSPARNIPSTSLSSPAHSSTSPASEKETPKLPGSFPDSSPPLQKPLQPPNKLSNNPQSTDDLSTSSSSQEFFDFSKETYSSQPSPEVAVQTPTGQTIPSHSPSSTGTSTFEQAFETPRKDPVGRSPLKEPFEFSDKASSSPSIDDILDIYEKLPRSPSSPPEQYNTPTSQSTNHPTLVSSSPNEQFGTPGRSPSTNQRSPGEPLKSPQKVSPNLKYPKQSSPSSSMSSQDVFDTPERSTDQYSPIVPKQTPSGLSPPNNLPPRPQVPFKTTRSPTQPSLQEPFQYSERPVPVPSQPSSNQPSRSSIPEGVFETPGSLQSNQRNSQNRIETSTRSLLRPPPPSSVNLQNALGLSGKRSNQLSPIKNQEPYQHHPTNRPQTPTTSSPTQHSDNFSFPERTPTSPSTHLPLEEPIDTTKQTLSPDLQKPVGSPIASPNFESPRSPIYSKKFQKSPQVPTTPAYQPPPNRSPNKEEFHTPSYLASQSPKQTPQSTLRDHEEFHTPSSSPKTPNTPQKSPTPSSTQSSPTESFHTPKQTLSPTHQNSFESPRPSSNQSPSPSLQKTPEPPRRQSYQPSPNPLPSRNEFHTPSSLTSQSPKRTPQSSPRDHEEFLTPISSPNLFNSNTPQKSPTSSPMQSSTEESFHTPKRTPSSALQKPVNSPRPSSSSQLQKPPETPRRQTYQPSPNPSPSSNEFHKPRISTGQSTFSTPQSSSSSRDEFHTPSSSLNHQYPTQPDKSEEDPLKDYLLYERFILGETSPPFKTPSRPKWNGNTSPARRPLQQPIDSQRPTDGIVGGNNPPAPPQRPLNYGTDNNQEGSQQPKPPSDTSQQVTRPKRNPNYVDAGTQTDFEPPPQPSPPSPPSSPPPSPPPPPEPVPVIEESEEDSLHRAYRRVKNWVKRKARKLTHKPYTGAVMSLGAALQPPRSPSPPPLPATAAMVGAASTSSSGTPLPPPEPPDPPHISHPTQPATFTTPNSTVVTAQTGSTTFLPCSIQNAGEGTVSWIRRNDFHLLTVGPTTYSNDGRFQVAHRQHSDDWTLQVKYVQMNDSGIYECQVSSHPPASIFLNLHVIEARAVIAGPADKFVKAGSTLRLECTVQSSTEPPLYLFWFLDGHMVNFDEDAGFDVKMEPKSGYSYLNVAAADRRHAGNYSCAPSNAHPASALVHVLTGEYPAAMQHGGRSCCAGCRLNGAVATLLAIFVTLQLVRRQ